MINLEDLYIHLKNYPEKKEITEKNHNDNGNDNEGSSLFSETCVKENRLTLEERINNLPADLKKKIYIDYFGSIYIFNKFINKRLKMIESVKLDNCKIINIIQFIINNKTIVKYLLENNNEFRLAYNNHTDGKKYFRLMNWTDSFALSWLYYLYH